MSYTVAAARDDFDTGTYDLLWDIQKMTRGEQFAYIDWAIRLTDGTVLHVESHYDNSYAQQRTAKISRWDGSQWHVVSSMFSVTVPPFGEIIDELMYRALEVIFPVRVEKEAR